MSIEKPKENWTMYPNAILDHIDSFTPAEFKIISLMIRKTLGFTAPNCRFALSYLEGKTGQSRPVIVRALRGLVEKGMITLYAKGNDGSHCYVVNWEEIQNAEVEIKAEAVKNVARGGKECLPVAVKNVYPLKETIKRNYKKDINKYGATVPAAHLNDDYSHNLGILGKALAEYPDTKNRYSPLTNKEQLKGDIVCMLHQYYLEIGVHHPVLTLKNWNKVLSEIDNGWFDTDIEIAQLWEKYLSTPFNYPDFSYNLLHFVSDEIVKHRIYEMGGDVDFG